MEHIRYALALPAHITLGSKGLPRPTLYLILLTVSDEEKRFIILSSSIFSDLRDRFESTILSVKISYLLRCNRVSQSKKNI
jgi:hypothetical protein